MTVRRVGLVLAVLLGLLSLAPALDIGEGPGGLLLPVLVAAVSTLVLIGTVCWIVPAWRGSRRAGIAVAVLQLVGALTGLPAFFAPADVVPPGGVVLAALGSLVSVAVAVLILIDYSGALLYVLAATAVIAMYAGVVALASALLPAEAGRAVATLGALAVALLFPPVSALVRRLVGRPLFGGRVDGAATALGLSRGRSEGEDAVAAALAETVRVMRLSAARIVPDGEVDGGVSRMACEVAFDAGGGLALLVELPARRRDLGADERGALELVARTLGALAREATLTAHLREARAATERARATERAAIHRDLHDGIGPVLTGIAMRADAAHNLLPRGADAASEELRRVRADLRLAIAEVRRVVYGLRPLRLETRGVWAAIADVAGAAGAGVALPSDPPAVSEGTELALYRIALEALANAERHAPGERAHVRVEAGPESIVLTVENRCLSPATAGGAGEDGQGVTSMRARAAEAGGYAVIGPVGDHWRVRAALPMG